MSGIKKRQIHSAEFKAKVGLEAIRGMKTINEIAQEFGLHPVQVSQYTKLILDQAGQLFEGKRGPKPVSGFCRINCERTRFCRWTLHHPYAGRICPASA